MKTDAKTMAEIWKEIESNPNAEIETNAEYVGWVRFAGVVFNPEKYSYRLKPKTITLKNGVVIPEPLTKEEIRTTNNYELYFPTCISRGWDSGNISYISNFKPLFAYKTKEQAIEASKALFGLL